MSNMYVYMYVCMHVCTKSFLKTTTNSLCVCTHLANKADSDSDYALECSEVKFSKEKHSDKLQILFKFTWVK